MNAKRRSKWFVAIAILGALSPGLPGALHAQATGTVTGHVVDAASLRPLADAQISVPGTGIGTLSNRQGVYLLLNLPPGEHTVRIDLLGYASQVRTVIVESGQTVSLDFGLIQDAIALDELVVTGLGKETERRRLATSLDVISSEEIAQVPVTTLDQFIRGRVAGVTINATSSQPGSASLINFRGISSVYDAQTPIIYVDGVRVDNDISTASFTGGAQSSALADLLTSDVERIEVTRGGAASTLYGSDASTGVIQIFTKKGRVGAPRFTGRVEMGFDQPELKYMFDTRMGFPDLVEAGEAPGDFMERNFWKNGFAQNYYLAVDGGSDQVTYSIGGRISDEEGVQPKNGSSVYSLRGGVQATVGEDFTMDFSGNFTRSNFQRLYSGWTRSDGLTAFEVGDALRDTGAGTFQEAFDIYMMPDIDETVSRFIFSSALRWSPTDLLFLRMSTGVDYRGNEQRKFQPVGFTPGQERGEIARRQREFTSFSFDGAATFSWPRTESYSSDFTVGVQGYRDDESEFEGWGVAFALPGARDIDEAGELGVVEANTELFTGGIYVEEQFDMWGKLTLNSGVRIDASTVFGDEVSFETYPKAGLSYLVSEEDWFGDMVGGWWNDMKLRLAYGESGKPPLPFAKDLTFYSTPFLGKAAPAFDNPGNEDLRPERTSTLELGFDASFFGNRVGLDFTWYDATTSDALFHVTSQPVTGQGEQLRNAGKINNTGVELAWNVQIINRARWAWRVGGTFQYVDNKVTDMGGVSEFGIEGGDKRVSLGKPVGAWRVTTPVDTNGDGYLDSSDNLWTGGQPTPNKSGSFTTSFRIGDSWTISSLADWAGGHEVADYGSAWATWNDIFRREEIEGVPYPVRYDLDGNEEWPYPWYAATSALIYDGDWFKWRELSVRYSVPEEWIARLGADRGSLYGFVRNIWIWSRNDLVDPELNGLSGGGGVTLGSETSITSSPPRRFRFGVELVF